ncbi:hypothetical protein ACQ4PT_006253 [Festuca glaucescens]
MAQEERELQVRALDGRSTAVTLAAAASVRDLKAALRSSFPPAQISHNFHLFLKGAKLRLDAEIDSLVVSHGEFIVLVPFTRKSAQSPQVATPGEQQSANPPISPEVAAGANSAWKDIMDDLSSIPSSPNADAASKDLYSSSIPCAGSYTEDASTDKSPSTGSSRKRRKLCKENGSGSMDTLGVDSASEQPSMNKKNGFVKSAASSCHDKHPLGPAEMVEHLKMGLGKDGQIVHIEEIPCRGASYAELPRHLSEAMKEALQIYGSHPTFMFCTATSANPREHVMELAKLDNVELIQKDGSPCGSKYFLLWNPPLHRTKEGGSKGSSVTRRSSPIVEVSYMFSEMVQHGLRCIAFCKTRKLCELVLSYTREILEVTAKELVDSICVYRAGYIAEDRRKIEADLFEGKLHGVAATNALELGIDVGHIDATLHLGFPGSVASLWQQAGRSGRRAKQSLAIYVAFEGPLDQYFMKSPHKLFGRSIEHCQVDSHNPKVLEQHLACAAYEHPICLQYDENHFGSSLDSIMTTLKEKGYLINNPTGPFSSTMWNYIGPEKRPSQTVSIRAIEHDKYSVIDKLNNRLLEEIEESKAFFQVYEGAIYMHQGVNYLVEELDLSSRTAFCRKADVKYYTKTRDYTDINVIGGDFAYLPTVTCKTNCLKTTAQANDCQVTTKWFGFHRICKSGNKILDSVELSLPPYSYNSEAVWIRIPQSAKIAVEERKLEFRGGSHAASHAILNILPLHMMCSSSDLGTECVNPHETRGMPERILLYDKHPGGIGIASKVKILFGELLLAALELVSTCSCTSDAGCPNCIQVSSNIILNSLPRQNTYMLAS